MRGSEREREGERDREIHVLCVCVCCIPCLIFDDSVVHFSRESIIIGNHLGVKRFVVQDTVVCVSQREAKSLFTVIIECSYPPTQLLKCPFLQTDICIRHYMHVCRFVEWLVRCTMGQSVGLTYFPTKTGKLHCWCSSYRSTCYINCPFI